MGIFKKPFFWVFFLIVVTVILFTLIYSPNISKKNTNPTPSKISSKISAKSGSCLILEEKYCSASKLINWTYQDQTYKIIGFNLPEGTPIFSPIDGSVGKAKENGQPFNGLLAEIPPSTSNSTSLSFIGDLQFEGGMSSINVKKGQVIGYVGKTGTVNFGGYNLIIWVTQFSPSTQKFFTPEDVLNKLLPRFKNNEKQ